MVVCEYEHLAVRVLFSLICACMSNPMIWYFPRFASGTLGPAMFGLSLRDSCLVILFLNLICAVPPAYL